MQPLSEKRKLINELKKIKQDETKLLLHLDQLPPLQFQEATKALDNIYNRQQVIMQQLNSYQIQKQEYSQQYQPINTIGNQQNLPQTFSSFSNFQTYQPQVIYHRINPQPQNIVYYQNQPRISQGSQLSGSRVIRQSVNNNEILQKQNQKESFQQSLDTQKNVNKIQLQNDNNNQSKITTKNQDKENQQKLYSIDEEKFYNFVPPNEIKSQHLIKLYNEGKFNQFLETTETVIQSERDKLETLYIKFFISQVFGKQYQNYGLLNYLTQQQKLQQENLQYIDQKFFKGKLKIENNDQQNVSCELLSPQTESIKNQTQNQEQKQYEDVDELYRSNYRKLAEKLKNDYDIEEEPLDIKIIQQKFSQNKKTLHPKELEYLLVNQNLQDYWRNNKKEFSIEQLNFLSILEKQKSQVQNISKNFKEDEEIKNQKSLFEQAQEIFNDINTQNDSRQKYTTHVIEEEQSQELETSKVQSKEEIGDLLKNDKNYSLTEKNFKKFDEQSQTKFDQELDKDQQQEVNQFLQEFQITKNSQQNLKKSIPYEEENIFQQKFTNEPKIAERFGKLNTDLLSEKDVLTKKSDSNQTSNINHSQPIAQTQNQDEYQYLRMSEQLQKQDIESKKKMENLIEYVKQNIETLENRESEKSIQNDNKSQLSNDREFFENNFEKKIKESLHPFKQESRQMIFAKPEVNNKNNVFKQSQESSLAKFDSKMIQSNAQQIQSSKFQGDKNQIFNIDDSQQLLQSGDSQKLELDRTNSVAKQVDSQIHEVFEDEESQKKIEFLRKNTELSMFYSQPQRSNEQSTKELKKQTSQKKKIKIDDYNPEIFKKDQQKFEERMKNLKNLNGIKLKSDSFSKNLSYDDHKPQQLYQTNIHTVGEKIIRKTGEWRKYNLDEIQSKELK